MRRWRPGGPRPIRRPPRARVSFHHRPPLAVHDPTRRTPSRLIRKPAPDRTTVHVTPVDSDTQRKRPTVICLPYASSGGLGSSHPQANGTFRISSPPSAVRMTDFAGDLL